MAPRSILSGTISFGLVSVPVRMYAATSSKELKFHFVTKDELQPVGYDKVRKDTGEHVDPDDVVRAFEVEKGRYVPLDEDDVDRLDIELTHSIEICDFVDLDEIDPVFYRQAYFLAPQEGAEKPYALLVRALEQTGKVGIAKVVIRNKQHLAALRPYRGALVLETMYYADEVRAPELPKLPAVRKPEVEMAKTLVENLSRSFDPDRYHDRYRQELLDLLEAKANGKELPEPEPAEEGEVVDLMAALRESVERTKKQTKQQRRKPARKAS
ncbi:MAG: non-homologous end joining protein Ku [Gaiellaceae bacterium]